MLKNIWSLAGIAVKKQKSSSEEEELRIGINEVVADLYRRVGPQTKEQRKESLFRIAKKLGFESTDYAAVCNFLDDHYGIPPEERRPI